MEKIVTHPCRRCACSPDFHSLRDEQNVSPVDPAARFPCNGPLGTGCAVGCENFEGDPITITES